MPGHRYHHITRHCFVNAPFDLLRLDLLDFLLKNQIQPEIGLDGDVVYSYARPAFEQVAATFAAAGLGCTLHAPFHGLSLGDASLEIRQHSMEKLARAFALIEIFRPRSIVCHLNFQEDKDDTRRNDWFALALPAWQELLAVAARSDCPVMFENTYESSPAVHHRLLSELAPAGLGRSCAVPGTRDTPTIRSVGFCLDTGHVLAFAKNSWQDWLPALEPWLGQLHLHDNRGSDDAHQALGMGKFDFHSFFAYVRERNLRPLVTLEPHQREWLWQSLAFLDCIGELSPTWSEG